VGFLARVNQKMGREQPLGWQVLICLVLIVLAAAAGAAYALLRGRPYLDGALVPGGAVLLWSVAVLLSRVVDLLVARKRSRDQEEHIAREPDEVER
jgi:heme A synthase